MPLYKTINFSQAAGNVTQILIWNITESFEQLFSEVVLNEQNVARLNGMKSKMHQCGFLSIRKLLQTLGYTDFDLFYDELGKPHLYDGKYISITHSHAFSAIIISNKSVGIDIEMQREKIKIIADKFVNHENAYLNKNNSNNYIRKLTAIWGVKEAIFKIKSEAGISFKDHIKVNAFELMDNQILAELHFNDLVQEYDIYFEELQNFTLVYAFEK